MEYKYFVVYNSSEVIWCYEEEAYEKLVMGWRFYAVAANEKTADFLVEEACYIK